MDMGGHGDGSAVQLVSQDKRKQPEIRVVFDLTGISILSWGRHAGLRSAAWIQRHSRGCAVLH